MKPHHRMFHIPSEIFAVLGFPTRFSILGRAIESVKASNTFFAYRWARLPSMCCLWLALLGACGQPAFLEDPLHKAEVAALGPENPAVKVGPLHRPGQACAVCHRADGLADPYLAAGTIYRDPMTTVGVGDADVVLVDLVGNTFKTKTNCVGNFYVKTSEFHPVLPFWVSVQLGEFPYKMASPIHREASCSACHSDPAAPDAAGHVFVTDDMAAINSIPLRACGPADEVAR